MPRKTAMALGPIRVLMKKQGAEVVSRDALDEVARVVEEYIIKITQDSLKLARHSKRKKITADDVRFALKI